MKETKTSFLELIRSFWQADEPVEEGSLENEIKKSAGLSDENKELLLKTLKDTDYFAKKTFLNLNDNKATKKKNSNLEQTPKGNNSNYEKGNNNKTLDTHHLEGRDSR